MDNACRIIAAKYIRRQAKQLVDQLDGARTAQDINFVHRARVATRRLRSALKLFGRCFPKKRLCRWREAIRQTTTKLGDARDRDVQIEFLCGILAASNAKERFPGISRILVELEWDRERLQRKVILAVDRLERRGILRDMRRAAKRILRDSAAELDDETTIKARGRIEKQIRGRLDELLCHRDSLADPEAQEEHHAMRIAVKRLRYTLEIFRPAYGERLDEAIEVVKRMQTLLGEVHDCDVWAEHLDCFALKQRKRIEKRFGHVGRFARLEPGIDYLRQDRRLHRQNIFGELVMFWGQLDQRRFWENVRGIVSGWKQPPSVATIAIAEPNDSLTCNATLDGPTLSGDGSSSDKPILTTGS